MRTLLALLLSVSPATQDPLARARGEPAAWTCCTGADYPAENDRTVAWYQGHPSQRREVLAACANDPGHGRGTPDCINASEAKERSDIDAWLAHSRAYARAPAAKRRQ